MAYKNQKKNKVHIETLKNKYWRAANAKKLKIIKARNSMAGLDEDTIKRLLKMQGLI